MGSGDVQDLVNVCPEARVRLCHIKGERPIRWWRQDAPPTMVEPGKLPVAVSLHPKFSRLEPIESATCGDSLKADYFVICMIHNRNNN
jgi:hypothetical protein